MKRSLVQMHEFQFGCGRQSGAAQVVLHAREWLETEMGSEEDDERLLLLVDVRAAFDSIPHGRLIQTVERLLGPEWAKTVARVIEGQEVTIVHYDGFTPPVGLGRGVLQGSPLSVLLFVLYTCEPPPREDTRAYVDDLVARTTRSRLPATFGALQSWSASKGLELAEDKILVLAKTPFVWSTEPHRETVNRAKLLGACLHADRRTRGCENDAKNLERLARLVDFTNSHVYRSTSHEAATRALQERLPVLDVELLYRKNGVRAVCCYAAEDFPQLESPIRYVKRVWQYSRTKTATRSIRELASAETTKGSTLRSLEALPGAVDLLQAIIRRAVMPRATRIACKRCAALANAQHVLLADDATHNEVSDIRHAYPTDPPQLKGLLADFAKKRRDTIRHVAKRVKVLCDDPLAARWSSLVLRYLE
ncbi:hypothetical protein DIPPA_08562 [Diplonema papillatum]|nr:hypothetical protein DIPPA_08562 [Diplonema papillatum]